MYTVLVLNNFYIQGMDTQLYITYVYFVTCMYCWLDISFPRCDMKTSSGLVRGIHRWPVNSPHKGPVTRNFDAFFDLRLNKRLSKHWGASDLRDHRDHHYVAVMNLAHALLEYRSVRRDDILDIACDENYQYYYSN